MTPPKIALITFLLTFPGAIVLAFILCLAPFVLVYFLFARLASLVEEFRPAAKKKTGRGNRLATVQKFLNFLPSKK